MNISRYSKAIAAFAGALGVAVSDNVLDWNDAWQVATAVLIATGVVFAVPNKG